MNHLIDRLLDVLEQHNDAHHLDAAAGGTRATAHNHHRDRGDEEQPAPKVVVVIATLEARVRQQRDHMKQRSADALALGLRMRGQLLVGNHIEMRGEIETGHENQRETKDGNQVPTQFLVAPNHIETLVEQKMIHREVDARQQHEQDAHIFDITRLEITDARLMRAETARGDGRHGVANGIKGVHRSKAVGNGAKQCQDDVNNPKES